jgi:hypothetical protein
MRAKKAGYLFLMALIMAAYGCSDKLSLYPESMINGTWIVEFEATHYKQITYPEDPDPTYILTHTSTLQFNDGNFAINVDPPVPPFCNMWAYDSIWKGRYFIDGSELTLAADNITEFYNFEIAGDTLRLSLKIENRVDENGDSYGVMPIWGGLPWGRAMLCHGGSFIRATSD